MNTYTDHDGRQWTINQTVSELSQDLYADLVQALAIAKAYQDKNRELVAEMQWAKYYAVPA